MQATFIDHTQFIKQFEPRMMDIFQQICFEQRFYYGEIFEYNNYGIK